MDTNSIIFDFFEYTQNSSTIFVKSSFARVNYWSGGDFYFAAVTGFATGVVNGSIRDSTANHRHAGAGFAITPFNAADQATFPLGDVCGPGIPGVFAGEWFFPYRGFNEASRAVRSCLPQAGSAG